MPIKRQRLNNSEIQVTGDVEFTSASEDLALELIQSCLLGDLETAKKLIENGADAWVQNSEGSTALHAAASSGNAELVTFLLRKGNAGE